MKAAGVVPSTRERSDGLSHYMFDLLKQTGGRDIELGEIFRILSRHSHALLMVFLSFPLCLPVGIPVISTTLGLALGFIGLLLCIGGDLRVPRHLARKVVPNKRLVQITGKLLRVADRLGLPGGHSPAASV